MSEEFESGEASPTDGSSCLELNLCAPTEGEIVAPVLGKRARNRPFTCCDFCKVRKVKCDGKQPCTFCAERQVTCEYSQRSGPKRVKTEDGHYTRASRLAHERALINANARTYYLDVFLRRLNPVFRVLDPRAYARKDMSLSNMTRGQTFAEMMALAHCARALSHVSVAQQLVQQCRSFAGDLIDDFSSAAATGYFLIAMYVVGGDNAKAAHYANIAQSIAKMSPKDPAIMQLQALINASHILEDPHRPCYFGTDVRPHSEGLDHISLADVWGTRHAEHILHLARMFPKHSDFMDIWCRHKFVARYPENLRSDAFLSLDLVEESLNLLIQHENRMKEVVSMATLPTVNALYGGEPRQTKMGTQQFFSRNSCMVYFCAATGLVDAGREYCNRLLNDLQEVSSQAMGFVYVRVMMTILQTGNFVTMYKVHPRNERLDYRLYLRELIDIIRPLAPLYVPCGQVFEALKRCVDEPLSPPRFTARPDQDAVYARFKGMLDGVYYSVIDGDLGMKGSMHGEYEQQTAMTSVLDAMETDQPVSTLDDASSGAGAPESYSACPPSPMTEFQSLLPSRLVYANDIDATAELLANSRHASPLTSSDSVLSMNIATTTPSPFDMNVDSSLAAARMSPSLLASPLLSTPPLDGGAPSWEDILANVP